MIQLKGFFGTPFLLCINNSMEEPEDGRWNWWGEEPEEEEDDTDNE